MRFCALLKPLETDFNSSAPSLHAAEIIFSHVGKNFPGLHGIQNDFYCVAGWNEEKVFYMAARWGYMLDMVVGRFRVNLNAENVKAGAAATLIEKAIETVLDAMLDT